MSKYYIYESTDDYTIVQGDNGNMYEYQPDTNIVLAVNRYDGDIGEEISGKVADEIRAFCQQNTI